MQLKRRVALNGVWLDEIDSRIAVSSVEPADGRENISAVDSAAGYGQRITGNRRSTVDMVVKFRILEHGHSGSGQQARAEVLEKINAWAAAGGELTVDYKPGRRLNVILAQAPGEGSLWDYTKDFQITFRAYSVPYWQDVRKNSITRTNITSTTQQIGVSGSAKTVLDFSYTNTKTSTCNTLSINTGIAAFSFAGLGCEPGETLIIDHTEDGLLRIRIHNESTGDRSAMDKRSAESPDDRWIRPGSPTVTISCQRAGTIVMGTYGRYA